MPPSFAGSAAQPAPLSCIPMRAPMLCPPARGQHQRLRPPNLQLEVAGVQVIKPSLQAQLGEAGAQGGAVAHAACTRGWGRL